MEIIDANRNTGRPVSTIPRAPFVMVRVTNKTDPNTTMLAPVWMEWSPSLEAAKELSEIQRTPSKHQTLDAYGNLSGIEWLSPSGEKIMCKVAVHDHIPPEKATMIISRVDGVPGLFFGLIESDRIFDSGRLPIEER